MTPGPSDTSGRVTLKQAGHVPGISALSSARFVRAEVRDYASGVAAIMRAIVSRSAGQIADSVTL
jgi:hypothetical protein